MKFIISRFPKYAASCIAAGAFVFASHSAHSSITIGFFQEGSDVVARTSGTLETGGFASALGGILPSTGVTDLQGSNTALLHLGDNENLGILQGGGMITASGLSVAPTSASGDAFGFTLINGVIDFLIISLEALEQEAPGEFEISPETTFTFANQTLESIGLADLTQEGQVVYTNTLTGDTIVFIPEPSSMMMLALGAVGFTLRRRR